MTIIRGQGPEARGQRISGLRLPSLPDPRPLIPDLLKQVWRPLFIAI
jgi:hypothetical protein